MESLFESAGSGRTTPQDAELVLRDMTRFVDTAPVRCVCYFGGVNAPRDRSLNLGSRVSGELWGTNTAPHSRGGRRDRTLYADSPPPPPLPAGFWPRSAGPWAPKGTMGAEGALRKFCLT